MKGIKLHFRSPLHVGSPGWGMEEVEEILHSDTLYSALAHASLSLTGSLPGDIRISSAFPFTGEHLFFPRPLLPLENLKHNPDLAETYRKEISSAKFVEEECFRDWIAGREVDLRRLISTGETLSRKMKSIVRPRITCDRETMNTQLYFIGETWFAEDAGLFCLLDLPEDRFKDVMRLFGFLGEEGIGGDRSSGYGRFVPEAFSWEPLTIQTPASWVTLSLVYPMVGEENHFLNYRLTERGGWVYSPGSHKECRRPRVTMVLEGGVFGSKVEGHVIDTTPPGWDLHEVYRYGKAYLIPAGVEP